MPVVSDAVTIKEDVLVKLVSPSPRVGCSSLKVCAARYGTVALYSDPVYIWFGVLYVAVGVLPGSCVFGGRLTGRYR